MNTEQQHKKHEVPPEAVRGALRPQRKEPGHRDEQVAPPLSAQERGISGAPPRAVPVLAPVGTDLPRRRIARLPPGAAPALRKDIAQ
ncbi:hypothetical protein ACIHCQ_17775 [Streptomyces sp. NPDC052236]|uniref:hypothetical protein n=1 Tax=Streptomyces sp. NPDC052236 TaxID=3365686 RepID=UPI0037D866F4